MDGLRDLLTSSPSWGWSAICAVLLIGELLSGSGWLLWPAASAGVLAIVTGTATLSSPQAVLLFAALTVVSTVLARRFLPRRLGGGQPDINDAAARLIGHEGRAVADFVAGVGRVQVEGKEWPADLVDQDALQAGARVEVVGLSGVRLRVRGF